MFGNYRTLTFIGLVIVLGFFVISPQWTAIQSLKIGIDEYSEVLRNLSTYNQQLTSLLARRDMLSSAEMERFNAFIGRDGIDTAQVVYNLEQALHARNLSLVALHPFAIQRGAGTVSSEGAVGTADFMTQDIELTVSGTYSAFKDFVQSIEMTLEPYEITYIKFNNESNSDTLAFTVRIRVSAIAM